MIDNEQILFVCLFGFLPRDSTGKELVTEAGRTTAGLKFPVSGTTRISCFNLVRLILNPKYINGKSIGMFQDGYDSFISDITPKK